MKLYIKLVLTITDILSLLEHNHSVIEKALSNFMSIQKKKIAKLEGVWRCTYNLLN